MDIFVSQANARVPVTIFAIQGQINADTAPQLQTEAEKAIKSGARHLLLDLTQAPYISSAGLRVLAYLMVLLRKWSDQSPDVTKSPRKAGGHSPYLKILNPSPDVLRALTMVGFDLYLEIYTDYQEAMEAF